MIDKLIKYLVIIPVVILALCPPLPFSIPIFRNSLLWVWLVLISGFLTVAYFYTSAQLLIKIIVGYLFINCFFSSAPYLSFTAYLSIISIAYFYLLCLKIKDWSFIVKAISAIVILNVFFLIMQLAGKDSLLNFTFEKEMSRCYGAIGNSMQLRTFFIICLAFIINYTQPKFLKKYFWWVVSLLLLGVFFYVYHHGVINSFPRIRWVVWLKTIELIKQHPIIGWGGATFRIIFQALGNGTNEKVGMGVFSSPHNEFMQIPFEYGSIGLGLMLSFFGILIYRVRKNKIALLSIGLVLSAMMVHFPFREIQVPLIIILFLAHCLNLTKVDNLKR